MADTGHDAFAVITAANTGKAGSLTYRQLDYWTRKGYLKPHERPHGGGSGYPRDYSDEELAVAVRMARLVGRGLTPKAAAAIARRTPTKPRENANT